jgi:hypothetical protein
LRSGLPLQHQQAKRDQQITQHIQQESQAGNNTIQAQIASKNSSSLCFMISAISIFIIFIVAIRGGENPVNTMVFIIQSWSFLFTPLLIIKRNPNLKAFAFSTLNKMFKINFNPSSFLNTRNQIRPVSANVFQA